MIIKPALNAVSLLLLIFATIITAVDITVVDLSLELKQAPNINDSPGATAILNAAKEDKKIRSALVLEKGKIVVQYSRPATNNIDKKPYDTWSTTKSWTGILIGILVDAGQLDIEERLVDVWPASSEVWNEVRDAEIRQQVTIRSLLAMTSGLVGPEKTIFDNPLPGGNSGGKSLSDSLQYPDLGDVQPGNFSYLPISNILSYVIEERSGLSPNELASQTIFPALGMSNNNKKTWWKNYNGMEYAFHGLPLTAVVMAKFGQLLLQNGRASNNTQVVSSDWVQAATSPQTEPLFDLLDRQFYGYLFWVWEDYYCALGYGGQDICVHPALQRLSVQQRDPFIDPDGNLILAKIAMQKYLSFGSL